MEIANRPQMSWLKMKHHQKSIKREESTPRRMSLGEIMTLISRPAVVERPTVTERRPEEQHTQPAVRIKQG